MKQKVVLLILVVIALITSSCRSSRIAGTITPENTVVRNYLDQWADLAVREMRRTGIPASIKLAQGMIESDHGRSRLARDANNHFGIKCHSSWTGPVVYHDDDDLNECFRKYRNAEQSFIDHSEFLVSGSRYRSLFDLRTTDYKGWARGLSRAGYATNPAYADMLIRKIEINNLHLYDRDGRAAMASRNTGQTTTRQVSTGGREINVAANLRGSRFSAAAAERIMVRNRVNYIIVRETDSFESLREDFNLLSWEIEKYNEKPLSQLLVTGNTLYLQPKRNRAEAGSRYHIVAEGETMYTVSQRYAVKLENLYKRNFIDEGTEPEPGRRLILR